MVTYKDLKLNDNNPRTINSDSFKQLKKSVKGFLKFLEERPILYDENKIIWAGNQRYRALSSLIKAGEVEDNPKYYKELIGYTELEKQQAAILDNSPEGLSGRWDFDMLANKWSDLPLEDWGINVLGWVDDVEQDPNELWDESGMPDYGNPDLKKPHRSIIVHFKDDDEVKQFADEMGQKITDKTKFIWFRS